MPDELNNLKIGDFVIIYVWHVKPPWQETAVTKVTTALIYAGGFAFRKSDGRGYPGRIEKQNRILISDKEGRAEMRSGLMEYARREEFRRLRSLIRDWLFPGQGVSLETLQAILKIKEESQK